MWTACTRLLTGPPTSPPSAPISMPSRRTRCSGPTSAPSWRALPCSSASPRRSWLQGRSPNEVARRLATQGISVWDGDNYAFELMHRFGLAESGGAVRASIVLYNNASDIDRFLEAVADIARG